MVSIGHHLSLLEERVVSKITVCEDQIKTLMSSKDLVKEEMLLHKEKLKKLISEQGEKLIELVRKHTRKQIAHVDDVHKGALLKLEEGHNKGLLEMLKQLRKIIKKESKPFKGEIVEVKVDMSRINDFFTLSEIEKQIKMLSEQSDDLSGQQTWDEKYP